MHYEFYEPPPPPTKKIPLKKKYKKAGEIFKEKNWFYFLAF